MKYMKLTDGTVIETTSPEYWTEAAAMTAKAGKAAMVAQAKAHLLTMVKPGDTVHTILRHVSGSGMSRRISFVVMVEGKPVDVSGWVARALDYRRHDRDGSLVVGGCGMDMGFSVVYALGHALFPKGFKVDGAGRNGDTSGHDNDGGYALRQRWL